MNQEGKSKASGEDEEDIDELEEDDASVKPFKTTFELNDTLFAEAEIDDTDTVYLWLGVRISALIYFTILILSLGQCDVVVQTNRSNRSSENKTPRRRHKLENYDRGYGVFERTTDDHGG